MPRAEAIEPLLKRFEELEKIGPDPDGPVARTRGNDFENLLLDLFQAYDVLLRRSFHTADNKREQIDGAIRLEGRIALVEAKWTKESVAASELYAFLGKVEGKFTGTIGVFVSRTPLGQNFVGALRAGRRQSIIVIHGDDVPFLFRSDFALLDYLRECLHHVSIDNEPHLPARGFLATKEQRAESEASSKKEQISALLEELSRPEASGLIGALADSKAEAVLVEELTGLLKVFPKVLLGAFADSPLRSNLPSYISDGARRLPHNETPVDAAFLGDTLPSVLSQTDYLPIVSAFSARLAYVSHELRAKTSISLVNAWNHASGTFADENRLVGATDVLWPHLNDGAKYSLLTDFVEILNSYYRRPGFPQFELAKSKVNAVENKMLTDDIILNQLIAEYRKLLCQEGTDDDKTRKWAWKTVVRSFDNAKKHIRHFDSVIDAAKGTITDSNNGAA
jgi:hypothetical protein